MAVWKPEEELVADLDAAVPGILESQKSNGQFGTEPWISTDQNVLLALAAAWSLDGSRYHKDDKLLESIVRGGDALIEAMDEAGMWTFRKKDHSTWGQIYQPWIYSRWVRAYHRTRQAFGSDDRDRWDKALQHGFTGIAETCFDRLHNIPMHHAMGLTCAGLLFDRPEWVDQAAAFARRIADHQSDYGWWPEHDGPVVSYNLVYVEALGITYSMTGDEAILESLRRAARFHADFVYPDGSLVETIDGRNPYKSGIRSGNPGFSHTPEGRGLLAWQHELVKASGESFSADYAANMLLHAGEGEAVPPPASLPEHQSSMGDLAAVTRSKPWFACRNAFRQDVNDIRWAQDRQSFVSLFHDRTGLILGGGNTKVQPLWSNFVVGDPSHLKHRVGEEEQEFIVDGVRHVPDAARLIDVDGHEGVELTYGDVVGRVVLVPRSDTEMGILCEVESLSGERVEGHLTLIPRVGEELALSTGDRIPLGEPPFSWHVPGRAGAIQHNGWRLLLPAGARVEWPAMPYNPYAKGGEASVEAARIAVIFPFSESSTRLEAVLQVE